MMKLFTEIEVEQYGSLYERYSQKPDCMLLNLEIYCLLC